MKQPRRWAVLLTALLMAASLVFAPREGSAGAAGGRTIMPGDPRPTPELGTPETPPDTAPVLVYRTWLSAALLSRGICVDIKIPAGHLTRSSSPRLVRITLRRSAKP
jgi:hypothetical protein